MVGALRPRAKGKAQRMRKDSVGDEENVRQVGGKDGAHKVIRPDQEAPPCYVKQFRHYHRTSEESIEQLLLKK